MIKAFIMAMVACACLFVSSCSTTDSFAGDWVGSGTDSDGNEFTFAATVTAVEDNGYVVRIFDAPNSQNEPLHVMKGIFEDGQFVYTADEGLYHGGGELKKGTFTGFYLGPVNGTFTMQRLKE